MYTFPVLVSFLVSIVIPFIGSPWIPQVFLDKGIDANVLSYPTLYICLLAIWLIWAPRSSELRFVVDSTADRNYFEHKLAIWLVVCVWCLRISYFIFERDSIYVDVGSNTLSFLQYLYVEMIFRLYPLVLILILLNIEKKISVILIFFEILYGIFIFSKFIVIIAFIGGLYLFRDQIKFYLSKYKVFFPAVISLSIFLFFTTLHAIFGELRLQDGLFSNIRFEFSSQIFNGMSRLQSVSSIFFAEQILEEYLFGKSFCVILGFSVPDWFYSLPYTCRNIDEDTKLIYLGVTDHRIINKDLFSFWGEPYVNFGVFGFIFIVGYCSLATVMMKRLGSNRYGFALYAVFLINTLISHQSFSLSIRNIFLSFVILFFLQQISRRKAAST